MEWVMISGVGKNSECGCSECGCTISRVLCEKWECYLFRGQKFEERPVELFRTLFISQMPDAGENHGLHVGKMPGQRLHRRNVDRWILASPHQQSANPGQLRQQLLQFPQIRAPGPDNTQPMIEQSGPLQRRRVAFQTPSRN